MTINWTKSDVPTVDAGDLLIATRLWLGEAKPGPVSLATVSGRKVAPHHALERRIADAYGADTGRSLAIILRLRCLMAAFACRRFQSYVTEGDEAWLLAATAAAAGMRVNAEIGFSPVRLAWAIAADEEAMAMTEQAGAIAA